MKAKPQPLALKSAFMALVRAGTKNSTIRKGRREVQAGDSLILTDTFDDQVMVSVTDVGIKCLAELTESDAKRDGFRSLHELFETLSDIYPKIEPQDPVTIIGFEVVDSTS